MIEFLSGMVTMGYLVAAIFFLRFWRKTAERLFLAFAAAFGLFALNQALSPLFTEVNEPASAIYILRILGFVIIIGAIVDKNLVPGGNPAIDRVVRRR